METQPEIPSPRRLSALEVAGNASIEDKELILYQNACVADVPDRWGHRMKQEMTLVSVDINDQSHGRQREAVLTFEIVVQPYMCNAWDVCHGGMISTLLDFATSVAIPALLRQEEWRASGLTLSLNINFMSPALIGEKLRIIATTKSCGKRTASVQGELWSSRGLVATCSHIKMIPHGKIMRLPNKL